MHMKKTIIPHDMDLKNWHGSTSIENARCLRKWLGRLTLRGQAYAFSTTNIVYQRIEEPMKLT